MANNDNNKEFPKVNINWYPGHMAKTKKQIIEDLRLVDIVVEILDARIPVSSQNPDIGNIIKDKKKLIVLNKSDLSDENQNKKWIEYFEKNNSPAVLVDSNSGKGIREAIKKIENIYQEDEIKFSNKGRVGRNIKVMVLGIPNVGKSSFINRVTQRNSAQVGNRPGVTRQKQWIRINEKIELLDTPGVLWPKFQNEEVGLRLAFTGTIKDDVIELIEIGFELLKQLIDKYTDYLAVRYKLDIEQINKIMENKEIEENSRVVEIMEIIGKKRGAIISGDNVDLEKVARIIIDDFRSGKIGRITLETI